MAAVPKLRPDLLIVGMGAAAQLCALYAHEVNPELNILIVTKALKGKGGCSRMVQGGFNVVLNLEDSHEKHLMDTLKGGQYINDQELAKTLVEQATPTIKEMETKFGCFFDRNPDGTDPSEALCGPILRSHRTQRRSDRNRDSQPPHGTGDEAADPRPGGVPGGGAASGRIRPDGHRRASAGHAQAASSLWPRRPPPWSRPAAAPRTIAFMPPGRRNRWTASPCSTGPARVMKDMEMLQFHPTGLIVPGSVVAGSLLEEGLRGSGAYLYNGDGRALHAEIRARVGERATRDVVSRSSYLEMMAGRACPEGGVQIDASHLGADFVLKNFPGHGRALPPVQLRPGSQAAFQSRPRRISSWAAR